MRNHLQHTLVRIQSIQGYTIYTRIAALLTGESNLLMEHSEESFLILSFFSF